MLDHHTKSMHLCILLLALAIATTQAFSTHNNNNNCKISARRVADRAHNIHKSTLKYRSINIEDEEYYCNDIHPAQELQLHEIDRVDSRLILARLQQADFNTPFTDRGRSSTSTSTKSISHKEDEEKDSSLVETAKAFLPVAVEIGAVVSLTSNHVQVVN